MKLFEMSPIHFRHHVAILFVYKFTKTKFDFSDSNWLPIRDSELPSTRPGSCVEDSTSLPESHLNFIKRHSLMDDTVPSNGHGPIFVKTSMNERLTAIAVDPGVKTPGDDNADQYDVSSDFTNKLRTIF